MSKKYFKETKENYFPLFSFKLLRMTSKASLNRIEKNIMSYFQLTETQENMHFLTCNQLLNAYTFTSSQ